MRGVRVDACSHQLERGREGAAARADHAQLVDLFTAARCEETPLPPHSAETTRGSSTTKGAVLKSAPAEKESRCGRDGAEMWPTCRRYIAEV